MTDYGQLLPNRVVHLTDQNNITKSMLTHIFAKALVKLGMVSIGSWNTYDPLDPANAEFGVPGQGQVFRNFFFDFPTSETFVVNEIPYRPCISMYAHTSDNYGSVNGITDWTKGWGIQLGVRRADRLLISDFRSSIYYRVDGGNFGNHTTAFCDTYKFGMHRRFKEGAQYETTPPYWRPFAASSMVANTQVVGHNFKSIYLYLGKAGLFCFIGNALTGPGFGNILSAGIVFAGGRIPGRGRVPVQDPNLNRINPTIELPMFNGVNGTDYWDGALMRNPIVNMQHDLKNFVTYPVLALIYDLENVEQPLYPSTVPHVLRSPRVVNGAGAYVLSRMVIVPQYVLNDTTNYAGPIDPQITGTAVRPQWADVFTAQNFRFGDRTVTTPVEYTDPLTSKLWFLVYAENTNMAYALDYNGRTIFTDTTLVKTLYETVDVDFAVGGLAGPFPAGITVTVVNGGPGPTWTAVTGQNELRIVDNGATYPNKYVDIFYTPPITDPPGTVYVIEVETKAPATYIQIANQVGLDAYIWNTAGTATQQYREFLTTVITDPQYVYRLHTMEAPINPVTGRVQFELNYFNPGYSNTATPSMRNFKIKKYTYA